MIRRTLLSITLGVASFALVSAAGAQTYHVIDFGSIGGFGDAESFAIGSGAAGPTLVGFATASSQNHLGFVGDAGNLIALTPLAGDTQSCAFGVDGGGRVIGVSYRLGFPDVQAFRVSASGVASLGNFTPRGVNPAGDIAGVLSRTESSGLRVDRACTLLDGGAGLAELAPLAGNMNSTAYAINSARVVVGSSGTSAGNATRPMAWVGGAGNDLGTLGGSDGAAYAINDTGVAVGFSTLAAGNIAHATKFVLGPTGAVQSRTDLGTLAAPGNAIATSYAFGVNSSGEIVGQSAGRAFVVLPARGMLDLNGLVPESPALFVTSARAIDDLGRIAGTGVDILGRPRPVLLLRCDADFDRNGTLNVADIFIYLAAWFGRDPRADIGGASGVSVEDLFIFLSLWFAAC